MESVGPNRSSSFGSRVPPRHFGLRCLNGSDDYVRRTQCDRCVSCSRESERCLGVVQCQRTRWAPAWIQLLPSGQLPDPRAGQSAVYDSASNRMIIFGGCGFGCTPLAPPIVWVLTNANGLGGAPVWIQLPTSGGPAPRTEGAA